MYGWRESVHGRAHHFILCLIHKSVTHLRGAAVTDWRTCVRLLHFFPTRTILSSTNHLYSPADHRSSIMKEQMEKSKWKHLLQICVISLLAVILLWANTNRHWDFISMPPFLNKHKIPEALHSITPIKDSKHFMVSAFIDHRMDGIIRVISIINRDSLQPLYCLYCLTEHDCKTVKTDVQIHSDHFGFPFHVSDVICEGKHLQNATHVLISTNDSVSRNVEFLPIRNHVTSETFKYNFTVCISTLFGDYNNVLQFAQSMEMYKLLGIQRVIVYNTSCGPDLEKLLKHYEREGILEIVSWPIDKFLNPSSGWNFKEHKGDLHYYGQLVTLNECIYRYMYQSKYVLLNDIDEIIMPYKYASLPSLMEDLQAANPNVGVFVIENHIFPKTQFEDSGRFKRPEWSNIPGVNIMEHIYREPDRKNVFNPTKMIVNPRMVQKTSVHSSLQNFGNTYRVPFDVCRIVHVRVPLQGHLSKDQLIVDKRVWDFEQKLVPNVDKALKLSGLF